MKKNYNVRVRAKPSAITRWSGGHTKPFVWLGGSWRRAVPSNFKNDFAKKKSRRSNFKFITLSGEGDPLHR